MTRAQRIITNANIPTLTIDQLAILTHVDMMTNRHLMEEVHKDCDAIFSMTYNQELYRFRSIYNVLSLSKTKKYDGEGEGVITNSAHSNNTDHVGRVGFTPTCFKCGTEAQIAGLSNKNCSLYLF